MKRIPFLISLLLVCVSISAQLQGFKVNNYTTNNGLSQNTVYCSLQDKNGYMWFGTRSGGLDRFDGIEFKHHRRNPYDPFSIGGNEVNTLFEDSEGLIWAGLRNKGLSKYNPSTQQFTNYYPNAKDTNSLCSATVYGIEEDKNGEIWLATGWGLTVYNKKTNTFNQLYRDILHNRKIYYKGISSISKFGDKYMLLAELDSGLTLINVNTKKIEKTWVHDSTNPNSLKGNHLLAVMVDNNKRIWIGSNQFGIAVLNSIESDKFIYLNPEKNNLASKEIRGITQDSKGNIWISTNRGLNIIESNKTIDTDLYITKYTHDESNLYSLKQNALYNIKEDRQGNVWIGTWSAGVNYINVNKNNFEHHQCIPGNNRAINMPLVRSLHKRKNKIWVGTQGGGINILDLKTGKYEYTLKTNKFGVYAPWVSAIKENSNGVLFIGTINNGLIIYDSNTKKSTNLIPKSKIQDILISKGKIWVLNESGVFLLNVDRLQKNPINFKDEDLTLILKEPCNVAFQDNKQRIWLGGPRGLKIYSETAEAINQFEYSKADKKCISANLITSISQDNKNNIWIGTLDGLNVFNEDSLNFNSFGEWDGLKSNEIQNIFIDKNNNIWVSSPKGLSEFTYNSAASSENMLTNFKHYTVDDGLQDNMFSNNCNIADSDGKIYIGGVNGYNSFYPDQLEINQKQPEVIITDFELFNKPVSIANEDSPLKESITKTSSITLDHTQNIFSFKFAAINYIAAEKNQYAYKMEGFDDDWNYIGTRREANYTKLPTGTYTFRVKASNNDDVWNEEGTSIEIIILPPWYETWWFRSLVAIIIAGSIIYLSRRRVRIIKERQRRLEQKVNEATAESESRSKKLAEAKERLSIIMDEVKLELGETSAQLLEATNSQASTIEEISASIDQMANEINTNATDAAKMHKSAKEIEVDSEISVKVVNNTVNSIEDIAKDIESISGFARTTNLLALNATIEAAKAGEYGRSFSVVANEIKKLADSSQEMAVNIKKTSNKGLESSREANTKITELQSYIHNIVLLIDQIKESSQNQSYEANNVNSAIQQISNYVSGTSGLAEKLDEAIKSLSIEDE
ncbi:ligand-binding sensor domain-containing protein [Saccharicrinis aurantiacus]|uniref:ligand-binding sensor domain-containing protein n=1 Tax=Saccharicrinis aurantiacus TaxID=1849719 RepID=UPI0009501967|nr:two-component regulator propeller domain-containing protein [Saccharicrinis aurantiacus]